MKRSKIPTADKPRKEYSAELGHNVPQTWFSTVTLELERQAGDYLPTLEEVLDYGRVVRSKGTDADSKPGWREPKTKPGRR